MDSQVELEEDEEELEFKRQASERAKIGAIEGFMVLVTAALADTFEIFAGLIGWIPILGWITWFFAFAFGLFVSGAIFIWAFLRGISGMKAAERVTRRLIALAGGFLADALTAGILPIRTITLAVVIWLNNRGEGDEAKRILGLLKKV